MGQRAQRVNAGLMRNRAGDFILKQGEFIARGIEGFAAGIVGGKARADARDERARVRKDARAEREADKAVRNRQWQEQMDLRSDELDERKTARRSRDRLARDQAEEERRGKLAIQAADLAAEADAAKAQMERLNKMAEINPAFKESAMQAQRDFDQKWNSPMAKAGRMMRQPTSIKQMREEADRTKAVSGVADVAISNLNLEMGEAFKMKPGAARNRAMNRIRDMQKKAVSVKISSANFVNQREREIGVLEGRARADASKSRGMAVGNMLGAMVDGYDASPGDSATLKKFGQRVAESGMTAAQSRVAMSAYAKDILGDESGVDDPYKPLRTPKARKDFMHHSLRLVKVEPGTETYNTAMAMLDDERVTVPEVMSMVKAGLVEGRSQRSVDAADRRDADGVRELNIVYKEDKSVDYEKSGERLVDAFTVKQIKALLGDDKTHAHVRRAIKEYGAKYEGWAPEHLLDLYHRPSTDPKDKRRMGMYLFTVTGHAKTALESAVRKRKKALEAAARKRAGGGA